MFDYLFVFLLLVFYFENIFVVSFFYGFCNYKFQIQLYVVSKNSYNLKPHTQLAIPFSKWKAKYFCPVENFVKRIIVYLRLTGPINHYYFAISNSKLNSMLFPQSFKISNPTLNSQTIFLSRKRRNSLSSRTISSDA